jgi:hypothetical protein
MKILTILLLFLSSFTAISQRNSNELSSNVKIATDQFSKLFLSEDFKALAEFATPELIEYLTSKEDLIYLMEELNKSIGSQGARVTNIVFGKNSSFFDHESSLQCTVPFTLEIEDDKKKISFNSGLALTSLDSGKTWKFAFRIDKDNTVNNEILGLNKNIVVQERTQEIKSK